MRVQSLWLRDFRNIEALRFDPDPGINFLIGQNGQGKTSILEGLGLLGLLRSFRGSKPPEILRWEATHAEVRAEVVPEAPRGISPIYQAELKVTLERSPGDPGRVLKQAWINGKSYRSSMGYLSQRFGELELGFHAVVFNPADHDLVRGEPTLRRAFIDGVIAAEDIAYSEGLTRYKKILEQRNALLKDAHQPPEQNLLREFTAPLVEVGARLALSRLAWFAKLQNPLAQIAGRIAPDQPALRVLSASSWMPKIDEFPLKNKDLDGVHFAGQGSLPSVETLEQAFWRELSRKESAEWRAGHTLVGPHRDDWAFFYGDRWLKGHGSQGETRTALLALKLAELQLFGEKTGHRPIFLLDDFSSELDRERRKFLLGFLEQTDLQVFVTTTEGSSWIGRRSWVSNGRLTENGTYTGQTENSHEHNDEQQQRGQ